MTTPTDPTSSHPGSDHPDADAFLAAVAARELTTVIMAVVDEYGPRPSADQVVDYSAEPHVTLLAYDAGHLLRCELRAADPDDLEQRCLAQGLTVHRRSRNDRTWQEG